MSSEVLATGKEMSKMTGSLKKIECDPTCGFMIRSHDEKELIDIVTRHAKKSHNMDISEKDVKKKIKAA